MSKNPKGLYKILSYKHKLLSTPIENEVRFPLSDRVEDSIYKAIDTLRYNEGPFKKHGIAMAAPQVGLKKRFFIAFDPAIQPLGRKSVVFCNPKIIDKSEEVDEDWEGCLSIPKQRALVERSQKIVVSYQNLNGSEEKREFGGFLARVFQHEYDHLNGVIMLSKAKALEENPLYKIYLERIKQEKIEQQEMKQMLKSL